MDDLLRVGVITSTHGIAGEVKVYPTTDNPARFKKLKKCIIQTKKESLDVEVCSVKFFKNMVILKFKQFNNINDMEKFRQADLMVTRENAIPLEEGQYYLCDLIGLTAVDENDSTIGTVTDVLQTGANDVYEITLPNGKEVLFPGIPQCLLSVDLEGKKIVFHIMKGLMD